MSLQVACPKCRSTYNVPDNMVGKSVRCKKCSQPIPVKAARAAQGGTGPARDPVKAPAPAARSSSSKPKESPKRLVPLAGCLMVMVVVLAGGGGVAWYYLGNASDTPESSVAEVKPTTTEGKTTPDHKAPPTSDVKPPSKDSPPPVKTEPSPVKEPVKEPVKTVSPPPPPPETKDKPPPPPEPSLDEKEIRRLADQLKALQNAAKAQEWWGGNNAIQTLSQMQRNEKYSKEVALAINPFVNRDLGDVCKNALKALSVWATPDSVPALSKLVEKFVDNDEGFSRPAMEILAKIKNDQAAVAIAARLAHLKDNEIAKKLLEGMGAAALKGWLSAGISANEGARTDGRKMAKQLEVKDAALVEYLAQEMKSTQPERRQWAAQWLTEVPVNDELRKAAIKGLEELLIDNNERVREQLGKALAKWATTKDDVPTLVVALDGNPSPAGRTALLEVLAKLKDERSAGAVAQCLPTETALAVPILEAIGAPAGNAVVAYIHHPNEGVRNEAAKLLTAYKTPEKVLTAQAVQDLKSTDGGTRNLAADRLIKVKPVAELRKDVIEGLKVFITSPDEGTRNKGVMVLGIWGDKDDVPPYIEMLDADATRATAIAALGVLKDKRGAEAVVKRLEIAGDRDRAIKSLQTMGAVAEDAVIPALKEKDAEVAIAACKVLNTIGTKKSLAPLRALSGNPNKQLVQTAGDAFKAVSARGK